MEKYTAGMIGAMVPVLVGCGSAVFAGSMAGTAGAGVGTVGAVLVFGLSIVATAYVIGGISECHINPAIMLGVFPSGCINGRNTGIYILFQAIRAIIGPVILYALMITGGHDGSVAADSNGFGNDEMLQTFIAEVVSTFVFVSVVLGSTDPKKGVGAFADLAIGLSLVLVYIVRIPITDTLVNPARSIGLALFQDGEALSQLWLSIVTSLVGAAVGTLVWNYFDDKSEKKQ